MIENIRFDKKNTGNIILSALLAFIFGALIGYLVGSNGKVIEVKELYYDENYSHPRQ
ncbi:MAG: hypothetical protein HOO93_19230 [Methyloglobulus sp.]|nr:hypothetical protein [Methyloglobulus sp.]